MTKKILIATDNLKEQINGVVTTFTNIEILARRAGYDLCYISPSDFKYIKAPKYPEVKLSLPWRIGQKIKEINPDYIHIPTEGPIGLATRLYCDKHGLRYNTSYHTKFPEFIKKIYKIPEVITYRYLRWFHKHSGKLLVTTNTMIDELKDKGFRPDMLSWTRGVDREILKPTEKHPDSYLHLKPIVLYVGRISKEKNIEVLCELQDKYNIQIVGDGPHRAYLQRKYQNVTFLGYQTGTELANSYVCADVFCFPSKADTFGIVIIEALSVGTPVAAYQVPGPIDILEQGVTGYMGDDLEKNIEDCLKLNRDVVRQASEKWTWDACWQIFKENLVQATPVS
jgi:glycosyltransferase involved in cell wall biosynthesis